MYETLIAESMHMRIALTLWTTFLQPLAPVNHVDGSQSV